MLTLLEALPWLRGPDVAHGLIGKLGFCVGVPQDVHLRGGQRRGQPAVNDPDICVGDPNSIALNSLWEISRTPEGTEGRQKWCFFKGVFKATNQHSKWLMQ